MNKTLNSIHEVQKISKKMSGSLYEAMNYSEEAALGAGAPDMAPEMEEPELGAEEVGDADEVASVDPDNVEGFINETRKKSLQIMAKLAEDPENPIYDIAKKIWQICDKAYNDQKEGNGLAQQQQMHQQQRGI